MQKKTNSLLMPLAKYTLVLPFIFLMTMSLSAKTKVNCTVHKASATDTIYTTVDKQPEFPGGMGAFYKFIGGIVHYPAVDMESRVQGNVVVVFVVEPDGSLSNIKAVRGPSETLKREALRVVSLSPKWNPGIKDGKAVRTSYTAPVRFVMTKTLY
ncbi:energy transducer TonB [Mucilaginibacter ximonensis]|uniref:Energy transducer TonB n=1 Tax=Mucilaginibacter ximonensis TaxID=538021 RepID=A0ABW5YAT3_9SPHI